MLQNILKKDEGRKAEGRKEGSGGPPLDLLLI
jgi:hypothetical protein